MAPGSLSLLPWTGQSTPSDAQRHERRSPAVRAADPRGWDDQKADWRIGGELNNSILAEA
jgi:hypothetical protein